jgi:hypothetical protein
MKYMMANMAMPLQKLMRNSKPISRLTINSHGIMALCKGKTRAIRRPEAIEYSYSTQAMTSTAPMTSGARTLADFHE